MYHFLYTLLYKIGEFKNRTSLVLMCTVYVYPVYIYHVLYTLEPKMCSLSLNSPTAKPKVARKSLAKSCKTWTFTYANIVCFAGSFVEIFSERDLSS